MSRLSAQLDVADTQVMQPELIWLRGGFHMCRVRYHKFTKYFYHEYSLQNITEAIVKLHCFFDTSSTLKGHLNIPGILRCPFDDEEVTV